MERTHSWLNRFRHLLIRWAKKPENYLAMLHFTCARITWYNCLFGRGQFPIRIAAKYAHFNTATVTANAANAGFEIEIPLAALGGTPLVAGSRLDLFAAYTDTNGAFFSEIIPQIDGRTTALGVDPDFKAIAGTQSVAFLLGTGVYLLRATKRPTPLPSMRTPTRPRKRPPQPTACPPARSRFRWPFTTPWDNGSAR